MEVKVSHMRDKLLVRALKGRAITSGVESCQKQGNKSLPSNKSTYE